MRDGDVFPVVPLRLFKQRLTAAARRGVCEVAGATHIVGDDALDVPDMAEGWGNKPHPLVVLPGHLDRLQNRIHALLTSGGCAERVSVLVTVHRRVAEAAIS